MPPAKYLKTATKVALLATLLCVSSTQQAHASYYTLAATNSVTAYANGWIYLNFVNAVNQANARVSSPSRAGYAFGSVYNSAGKQTNLENPHTTSTTWVYTVRSGYYGTLSITDWTVGKACVDVPFWADTCAASYGQI